MAYISGYDLKGYGMHLYCKITEVSIDKNEPTGIGSNYKCTMAFGSGAKQFCLTASYDIENPYEIYISDVATKNICIIDGNLSDFEDGSTKFVKIALWAMKSMYPHVKKYTLRDHSQIYCDGNEKGDKMQMAYDYILKYNETWYQRKFNAELNGFVSKKSIDKKDLEKYMSKENIDSIKPVYIETIPDSPMNIAFKSYEVLDKPVVNYALLKDNCEFLEKYLDDYNVAKSPRDFIATLRKKPELNYCKEVGAWLNSYMIALNVKLFEPSWYIPSNTITKPTGFSAIKLSELEVKKKLNSLYGGKPVSKDTASEPTEVGGKATKVGSKRRKNINIKPTRKKHRYGFISDCVKKCGII